MRVLTLSEFKLHKEEIAEYIRQGAIFIYPTDTIYGIGCNAEDEHAVEVLRSIKSRYDKPFSVIAPGQEWILKNCVVSKEAEEWLEKLPGPYTLIMLLKNKKCVAKNVNMGAETLGVRIPRHWISGFVKELGIPIVTTSVNLSGENYANSVDEMDVKIKNKVNFIIDEGEKQGKPSTLVHLDGEIKVVERK